MSSAVTVQITVFCDGDIIYDNAATTTGSTAWDAIKASGEGPDKLEGGWKLTHMAGCDGSWGLAFYINDAMSDLGVAECPIYDGDQLIFVGPNNGGPTAKILYLDDVPDVVEKNEGF